LDFGILANLASVSMDYFVVHNWIYCRVKFENVLWLNLSLRFTIKALTAG
jgi:hypothetical protein